jgi:voltage-gated potassium channel
MRQKRTQMMLVKYFCAAALLVMLTIWLQCGGIAVLIRWIRSVMEDNVDQLGFFHVAGLVVRFAIAVIVLHLVEVSLWASFYRWFCLPSWETAFYFSAGNYATVGCGDVSLPSNWRTFGPLESIIGVLMCGISGSVLFAIVTRLVSRNTPFSRK